MQLSKASYYADLCYTQSRSDCKEIAMVGLIDAAASLHDPKQDLKKVMGFKPLVGGSNGAQKAGKSMFVRYVLRCGLLVTILTPLPTYAAQSFDSVAGSWSGGGSMKPSDGPSERVRCKVDYTVKKEGQSVKMNVRCASDAYKMDLSANIDQNGSELSGNWLESQYRQGGKVSGQNLNGVIEARVEGQTITALLTVRTKGNHQTFVMDSPGAWVSHVLIELDRDAR